jgi:hypothetical protein
MRFAAAARADLKVSAGTLPPTFQFENSTT